MRVAYSTITNFKFKFTSVWFARKLGLNQVSGTLGFAVPCRRSREVVVQQFATTGDERWHRYDRDDGEHREEKGQEGCHNANDDLGEEVKSA